MVSDQDFQNLLARVNQIDGAGSRIQILPQPNSCRTRS